MRDRRRSVLARDRARGGRPLRSREDRRDRHLASRACACAGRQLHDVVAADGERGVRRQVVPPARSSRRRTPWRRGGNRRNERTVAKRGTNGRRGSAQRDGVERTQSRAISLVEVDVPEELVEMRVGLQIGSSPWHQQGTCRGFSGTGNRRYRDSIESRSDCRSCTHAAGFARSGRRLPANRWHAS
jgi:hypothetical protein